MGDKVIIPPRRDPAEYAGVYATKTGRRYVRPKELLRKKKEELEVLKELPLTR